MNIISHRISVFIAFFVTLLWSSSWLFIIKGLQTLSPVWFAGLRYTIASAILLVATFMDKKHRTEIINLNRVEWLTLLIYGILFISITQGLQFYLLDVFPAITLSFSLNFTTIIVVILSIPLLREHPTITQFILILIALVAAVTYFYPFNFLVATVDMWLLVSIVFVNAISSLLGRDLNRRNFLSPLPLTSISMSIGSLFLICNAILVEDLPILSASEVFIILWLALVNTAFAFTLWNLALKSLKAYEITVINNTMLPQITILAYIFLGEKSSLIQLISIIMLVLSAIGIQIAGKKGLNAI